MYQKENSQGKTMMISMDEDVVSVDNKSQNEVPFKNFVLNEQEVKPKRIQINSLESLKFAMEDSDSSNHQTKNLLSLGKKSDKLSLNARNSYEKSFSANSVQSISDIHSMDQSSLQFKKQEHRKQNIDEFQMDMQMNQDQKSDSPQKLRGKIKKSTTAEKISLLCPPQDIGQKSYQFIDQLYTKIQLQSSQGNSLQKISEFLHNPLPVIIQKSYMRYIFQIHLYKYTFTFHTCYEFYLRNSYGDMIHLARSQKDSLTVSSSYLLYATNPHKSGEKEFAAKLKYNTVKSEYNLYDIDEKEQPNEPRKLLATGFYQKPIGEKRDIKFYIPKLQYAHKNFIKSEANKNLAAFIDETQNQVNQQVEILRTAPIPKEDEAKVRGELELKNEGRRILVVNQDLQEKFYMGKRQNQRYVILASGELTPLQIFTLAILNLDH